MRRFRLDDAWVLRVIECVRSVSISILVNGLSTEKFTPARGIR